MKIILSLTVVIVLGLIMSSLKSPKPNGMTKKVSPECIGYNDTAIAWEKKSFFSNNPIFLDSALLYINKAIDCDSNFFTAYSNKISILNSKHDLNWFNGSLDCLNKMVQLSHNDPVTIFEKGTFYELNNMKDSAYKIYSDLNISTGEELRKSKRFNANKAETYILTSAILNGSAVGKKRYDSVYDLFQDSVGVKKLVNIKWVVDSIETKSYLPKSAEINIKLNTPPAHK
jgi:hypothetical protein